MLGFIKDAVTVLISAYFGMMWPEMGVAIVWLFLVSALVLHAAWQRFQADQKGA